MSARTAKNALEADVLVCGLGPAGASAAAAAARAGARVIAVDRRREPGLPVQCAEFVPMMIGSETPRLAGAAVQDITRMLTFVGGDEADLTPDFRGRMIDRARFDRMLADRAEAAGADCHFASPLRTLSASGIARLADGTAIRARTVVGADGPRSVVGRAIDCRNRELVETRQATVDLLVPHDGTDIFLDPRIVGGYGWLFPKGATCNVGVGVAAAGKHRLKPLLDGLLARLVAEGRIGATVHGHTGGAIPVGGICGPAGWLGDCAVLLAGDAAGLANPVTGAGINAAVTSGALAGQAAAAIAAGDADAADDYRDEIGALFQASIGLALRRRRDLMDTWAGGREPGPDALRDAWIAYPRYWARDDSARPAPIDEARMTP